MPEMKPDAAAEHDRQLVHTRQIACRAYRTRDGLFEIEATVTDAKGQEVPFRSRPPVAAGEFMHSMALSVTIDSDFTIREAKAHTAQAPWPSCGETDAAYRKLIGLRIGGGFIRQVRQLLGGTRGCTHITDIITQVANTYMQASFPDRLARQLAISPDPRQWPDKVTLAFVDQCHAWRHDGEALLREYPELAPKAP